MKKVITLISIFVFGFSALSNAQSFQTGSLIVSLSYGFDVYSVRQHQVETYTTPSQSKDTTNGAACGNINLSGEYAVTKWLGLGLQLKYDSYLHRANILQANGFEGGVIVNGHFIRHTHFDMFGGMDLGISTLTITANDGYNDQVYGSGSWFDVHLTTRIYFGRFGINMTLYFPTINYPTLTSNNQTFNTYIIEAWHASGTGFNIGFQYHFLQ
jgi:hypothetical protein